MERNISKIESTSGIEVRSQQSELIDDGSVVLNSDKTIVPHFGPQAVCSHNSTELHMGTGIPHNGSLATLEPQHYYESLHQAPIMVYEVPNSNIVPFDSLVTMPLSKTMAGGKSSDVDLLQASVSEGVYQTHHHHHHHHHQQQQQHQELSQPMYVLHQSAHHKKPTVDLNQSHTSTHGNMVVSQHMGSTEGLTSNIVMENKGHDEFHKVNNHNNSLEMPLGSEFNIISTSGYENAITTVTNMSHLPMSAAYHTSSETDSEVALTLASLGNPKNDILHNCNHSNIHDSSDVIRAASIIAGVSEHQHIESMEIQVTDNVNIEERNDKKNQIPTLILRSRKGRSSTVNQPITELDTALEPKKTSKKRRKKEPKFQRLTTPIKEELLYQDVMQPHSRELVESTRHLPIQNESQKENLLGQLLKASEHCEPASLIPEGVVDDVIPAVGYRIMDMTNLSEMIRMMHRCSRNMGSIVIQEQASLREGAVSQLSIICTGCQEGAVCATSNRCSGVSIGSTNEPWDLNVRVEQLTKEFNIKEDQVQRMLEILGIFYRPSSPDLQPMPAPVEIENSVEDTTKRKKKKSDKNNTSKPKNWICNVCKEAFAGENHLKQHMHSHDLSLHTCPYCHAYFKKPFNLKQHIKKHENYKFECKECSRVFTDISTLKCHIRSYHEKRLDIQCERCHKRFYHRGHYKEHMRTHTEEKPYMCELCGKKFSWHDSVKKHMQTHSAESKYKCRLCGKWFRWLQGVRQHLQQQHKLKKSDIEAQVVTAATQTATPVAQFQQPRHDHQQDTQFQQQQQQDQHQQQNQQQDQHQQQNQQQDQHQQQNQQQDQHHHQQQHQQQHSLHQSHHTIEQQQHQQQQQQQASGESSDPRQEYHSLEGPQIAEAGCVNTSADDCAAQALTLFQVPDSGHQEIFNYHQPIN